MVESLASKGEGAYEIILTHEFKIGAGNYGNVYKIKAKNQEKYYAGKFLKLNPDLMMDEDKLGLERELEIMQKLNSPFTIKLLDSFSYKQ